MYVSSFCKLMRINVFHFSQHKVKSIEPCRSLFVIVYPHQLLLEVGIETSVPVKLLCDNRAAMHITSYHVFHERTEHIDIVCYFVRKC